MNREQAFQWHFPQIKEISSPEPYSKPLHMSHLLYASPGSIHCGNEDYLTSVTPVTFKMEERSFSSEVHWLGGERGHRTRRRGPDRKNGCCIAHEALPFDIRLIFKWGSLVQGKGRNGKEAVWCSVYLLLLYFSRYFCHCFAPKQVSFLIRLLTMVAAYIFLVSCVPIHYLGGKSIKKYRSLQIMPTFFKKDKHIWGTFK